MDDLVKKIPIELTQLFNEFNLELTELGNGIELEAEDIRVRYNNSDFDGVTLTYALKNSSFFFKIQYLIRGDFINWKYYPYSKRSTQPKSRQRININSSNNILNELLSNLRQWKNNLVQVNELENPINFFKIDNFVKFYADEIIESFPLEENDNRTPLSSEKQTLALDLINKQSDFLKIELSNLDDDSDEKRNDLKIADDILDKMKENIARMTIADIKQNISISFGVIRKWCGEKFLSFLKIDKSNKYDISRMLGSFVGGVFGIPKIGE